MASSPVAGASSPTSAAPELMLPRLETSSWPKRARKDGETWAAWQTLEAPQELYDVPQDENFPQEVLNIIRWSLMRENKGKDTMLASELPAGDLADLVPEINSEHAPQLETSSKSVETQECESVKDQRSTSKDGKREKLRNLLKIKSSITDLSSEVKDSLTRVRNIKAAREAREKESSCTVECTGCFDDIVSSNSTKLSCSHAYCRGCFTTLVKTAMLNEQSWPAKCCLTEIPLKKVLLALDSKERSEYKTKAAEYAIPACERIYCPGANCHKLVPPAKIDQRSRLPQKCPFCHIKICRVCRGEAHNDLADCPEDYGLSAALESAQDEGWQRCHQCRTMVELTTGCRHITCKCGAEFCYICGLKWHTCACTEVDLVNRRAEVTRRRTQRVVQQAVRDAAATAEEQEIARAIAEVEEFERNQLAVRVAQQKKREREEREEEELLAKLEAMSLEEERKRKEAEVLAENQWLEVMHLSVIDLAHSLHRQLQTLVNFQQNALISRHDSQDTALKQALDVDLAEFFHENLRLQEMLTSNADKRRKYMIERHEKKVATLQTEHEKSEDAMFVEMLAYLKDKPNGEERKQRMRHSFKRRSEEERQQQVFRHAAERTRFDALFRQEMKGLEYAHELSVRVAQEGYEKELLDLSATIASDRQFFEFVTERRTRLMALHGARLVADVEELREPKGLTRDMAITNMMPFPLESPKFEVTVNIMEGTLPEKAQISPRSVQSFPEGLQVSIKALPASNPPTPEEPVLPILPVDSLSLSGLRTHQEATPILRIDSSQSGGKNEQSGENDERRMNSIWKSFGKAKRSSKQKYTDSQVREMLISTIGDAF